MSHSVRVMASLGLTYNSQRVLSDNPRYNNNNNTDYNNRGFNDITYSLVLEPAVEQLVKFDFVTTALNLGAQAKAAGGEGGTQAADAKTYSKRTVRRPYLSEEVKNDMLMELNHFILQYNDRLTDAVGSSKVKSQISSTPQKAGKSSPSPISSGRKRPASSADADNVGGFSNKKNAGGKTADTKGKDIPLAPGKEGDEEIIDAGKGNSGFFVFGGGRNSAIKKNDKLNDERKRRLAQEANNTIRFKFNQGFSNAVKRPVSITDFC